MCTDTEFLEKLDKLRASHFFEWLIKYYGQHGMGGLEELSVFELVQIYHDEKQEQEA